MFKIEHFCPFSIYLRIHIVTSDPCRGKLRGSSAKQCHFFNLFPFYYQNETNEHESNILLSEKISGAAVCFFYILLNTKITKYGNQPLSRLDTKLKMLVFPRPIDGRQDHFFFCSLQLTFVWQWQLCCVSVFLLLMDFIQNSRF